MNSKVQELNAFEAARFVRHLAEQQCDPAFVGHVRRDATETSLYVIKPPGNLQLETGAPRNYVIEPPETGAKARIVETQYEFEGGHRIAIWRLVLHRSEQETPVLGPDAVPDPRGSRRRRRAVVRDATKRQASTPKGTRQCLS